MSIFNDFNEFAALGPHFDLRSAPAPDLSSFEIWRVLGPEGRIDAAGRSSHELIILRAVLRDLPAETVTRLTWDPKQVIADIDEELHRRRAQS